MARITPPGRTSVLRAAYALLQRHALATSTGILLIALGAQALLKVDSEWQSVYVSAGRRWASGQDIYGAGSNYAYPPFMAMLAAPLAAMPEWLSRLIWFALSAIGMVVMVAGAWRLANGTPLSQMRSSARREWYAFAFALVIGLTYILNAFAHQQTDVLIGALLIAGALSIRTGGDLAGGALIGLAGACKATPLLWAPCLLWRRRWIAAALVGLVAVAVNLLPDLIAASPRGGWWLADWFSRFVLPTQQLDAALGQWASALEFNQALGATAQRLVNTALVFSPDARVMMRPALDAAVLKLIVYAAFLLLIAVSIVAAIRARTRVPAGGGLPDRDSYEFSIVLILMLLLSPMSSRAHFGTLILPAFCLARVAFMTRDRTISAILACAVPLAIVANKDLVGATAYAIFLWLGATTAGAMLLWLGCVVMLWRGASRPTAHSLSAA